MTGLGILKITIFSLKSKNMEEIFKTFEFKGDDLKRFGKYAHPIEIEKGIYEWGSSSFPLLMDFKTTNTELKKIYKGLDFNSVKLVNKKIINI